MENVSLTTTELKKVLKFVSGTTVITGLLVGWGRHSMSGTSLDESLLTGLISGIGYAVAVCVFLLKLPWTSKRLAQWTGRPLIHGVWFGKLTSSHQTRNNIPIAFVIRQTYLGYSIVSHTKLQDSETLVESLEVDDRTKIVRLRYIYQFQIMENNERKLTMGAGELKLLGEGCLLRGHYLTNSPTHGSAELQFVRRSVKGVDTFDAAYKAFEEATAAASTG